MTAGPFPHVLERTVVIRALPDEVFRFFTESARWASWWGAGSTVDPVPGGAVLIRYPNGVEVVGHVLAIEAPTTFIFTFGFRSGAPIAPGGSRVSIRLDPHAEGTHLHLVHEFAESAARDAHVQGWRYQLSVFANVAANLANAGAESLVDGWFAAWSEPDRLACARQLAAIASPLVSFRNAFSALEGREDLVPHIAVTRQVTPIRRLARDGAVRHCQGTLLADWCAFGADGQEIGRGTNVFSLDLEHRIQAVVAFQRT